MLQIFLLHFLHIFRDWEYYINLAGTELPLYDINEFVIRLKEANIPLSIWSMLDQNHPQLIESQRARWSYKYKEDPTR